MKNKRGSVLVLVVILMFIILIMSLSLSSTTVVERRSSLTTGKSTFAFQVADSASELVLKQIKNGHDTIHDLIDNIDPIYAWNCNPINGVATVDGILPAMASKTYSLIFQDANGNLISNCNDNTNKIAYLKSIGYYGGTIRAIEIDIEVNSGDVLDGLAGYWKFDDGFGVLAVDSVGTNDGILVNMEDTDWVAGVTGGAGDFALDFDADTEVDAAGEYIDISDTDDSLDVGTGDFSVSVWVYNSVNNSLSAIAGKGSNQTATGAIRYLIYCDAGGQLFFEIDDDVTREVVGSAANYKDGVWHHVVGVREGATMTLYIDGDGEIVPLAIANNLDLDNDKSTGVAAIWDERDTVEDWASLFQGRVDSVRIYKNKALSADEVLSLYDFEKP